MSNYYGKHLLFQKLLCHFPFVIYHLTPFPQLGITESARQADLSVKGKGW